LLTFATISVVLPLRTGNSLLAVVRQGRRPLLASAMLNTCSVTLFVLAIGLTTVANTVAIVAAAPIAAAVVARLLIGEKPSRRIWWAIAVSVVGILVIVAGSLGAGSAAGDLLAIAAVVAFAANVSLWRTFPGMSRLGVIGLAGLVIAIVAFVPADPFQVEGEALVFLAIMGILTGPAGRVALASSTRHLTAAKVGLFTPVESVAATAWAWIFLSEGPPTATVVGGLLVIGAVIYGATARSTRPRTRSKA
jgi:drug/metabolite transporter (DMT)-like permease